MPRSRARTVVFLVFVGLVGVGLLAGAQWLRRYRYALMPPPLPAFASVPPYTPWATVPIAEDFDFPLLPTEMYGAYVQGVTGPLAVDTRYGVQNPAMGDRANCFRDANGDQVPFGRLYHAGVDLFALDATGGVVWGKAAHAPVQAVATGLVVFVQDAGSDGHIIITQHLMPEGGVIYAVYWHTDHVQVQEGQQVEVGQVIAVVGDRGPNSHLHWEMRDFLSGDDLFPEGAAGARGTCNGRVAGVGYTWNDDPERAPPDVWGYRDPQVFVQERR